MRLQIQSHYDTICSALPSHLLYVIKQRVCRSASLPPAFILGEHISALLSSQSWHAFNKCMKVELNYIILAWLKVMSYHQALDVFVAQMKSWFFQEYQYIFKPNCFGQSWCVLGRTKVINSSSYWRWLNIITINVSTFKTFYFFVVHITLIMVLCKIYLIY